MNLKSTIHSHGDAPQSSYRTGKTIYRVACKGDDATLREILRSTPMKSWITLSTEHEPDYFQSAGLFGRRETLIAERDNRHASGVGMCSWTDMPVFIDGQPTRAAYLGELRVLPKFRGRPGIVRNGFRALHALSPGFPHWFTSIAVDNKVARRLLEAGLKDMPSYHPLSEMVTLALPASSCKPQAHLHACTRSEIPELVDFFNRQAQRFHYAPVLDKTWLMQLDGANGLNLKDFYLLRQNGRLQACFALWDQRHVKQTVVRDYRFPLNSLRPLYNLAARLAGRLTLPPIGRSIDYLFIAFLASAPDLDKQEFTKLISSALELSAQRGVNCAMLGLAADNPLLQTLGRYRAQTYRTCIEAVVWHDQEPMKLPRTGQIVQPEIALL